MSVFSTSNAAAMNVPARPMPAEQCTTIGARCCDDDDGDGADNDDIAVMADDDELVSDGGVESIDISVLLDIDTHADMLTTPPPPPPLTPTCDDDDESQRDANARVNSKSRNNASVDGGTPQSGQPVY